MRVRHAVGLLTGLIVLAALTLVGLSLRSPGDSPAPGSGAEQSGVAALLSGEDAAEGYARVTGPQPLRFPEDDAAHPAYRHEWWYVTGNLETADGRHLGYQLTFFRFNVDPQPQERASRFASNQVWMAHAAITDTSSQTVHQRQRLSRGAIALAGARAAPFEVWLDDWQVVAESPQGTFPARLEVRLDPQQSLELQLQADKPRVLQGDRGYSQKGPEPGNASRYFSWTRLQTRGRVQLDGEWLDVEGSSWLDREWGTSTLAAHQIGWDWFSLQLDNGRDLMVYQLRQDDGGIDPRSKGLLVERDGRYRVLRREEFSIRVRRWWRNPIGDARYPVAWSVTLPGEDLALEVDARVDDQEWRTGFRYWEGAVSAHGEQAGRSVSGVGYVELTGYVSP